VNSKTKIIGVMMSLTLGSVILANDNLQSLSSSTDPDWDEIIYNVEYYSQ